MVELEALFKQHLFNHTDVKNMVYLSEENLSSLAFNTLFGVPARRAPVGGNWEGGDCI